MSDEEKPASSSIIEEDVSEMEVVDASAVEDSNNEEDDERKPWDPIKTDSESEEEEYEVEKIVAARFVKKKRQYLVKWVNYAEEWNTWEPIENLEGSHELVEDFNKREREQEEKKEKQKAEAIAKKKAEKERKEAERIRKDAEKKEREEKKAKLEKEKKEVMEPSDSDNEQNDSTQSKSETPDRKKDFDKKDEKMKLKKEKKQRKKEIISMKDEKMRKKKEKLQKEREKWRKEKDEFRKREEDIARRKTSQNAYKKKESGADFYEDQSLNATNLAFPDEPEEKREKPVNEEVKIEEEATIRILLSASQAESEWQYYIGKKYRQFEKHGAKIQIIDALEPFLTATYESQIGYSELLLSITGTPKVISMTVKDLVDKLTQERYKKIPKVAKENKWIILNFLIRAELWDYICGKDNSSFYDFQIKCFSKVAAGISLNESCDRILRAEGRDAGLGLAARRIATVLTKELKEQNIVVNDENYVAYRPKAFEKGTGQQVEILTGRMEPKPDQVRVDGVGEITSVKCILNPLDEEDESSVNVEFVGEPANITKCKSCLISNGILTSHSIEANLLELFKKETIPAVKTEKRESCIYNLEHVVCVRSVIAHGLIGKIDTSEFERHAAQFGEIESIKQASTSSEWNGNSYNSFLIQYKSEESAIQALNKMNHFYASDEYKFIPYRNGDMESERQSRFVLLQNLPDISEHQLKMRFENDGVVAARLIEGNPKVGYLLLTKKQSAQRFHKNGTIEYHPGKNFPVNTLDVTQIVKVLDEEARRKIFTELEIGQIDISNDTMILKNQQLKWYAPVLNQTNQDRKRKFPTFQDRDPLRLDEIGRKPKTALKPANINPLANIMSSMDVEKDEKTVLARKDQIDQFKRESSYAHFIKHCENQNDPKFKEPDHKARYVRETHFQRKKFEWSNAISEWTENHRNQRTQHTPPPDEDGLYDDLEPMMDDDDPFNPSHNIQPAQEEPYSVSVIYSSVAPEPGPVTGVFTKTVNETPSTEQSFNPNTNLLMPTRRKRRGQTSVAATPSNQSPVKSLPVTGVSNIGGGGGLKSILGGLDKDLLERLKNKNEPETEIEFDPKQSILSNPPQELRSVLRLLRLDVKDLKTLLDIPLPIISSQNVISLIELKHSSLNHVDRKDTIKLVDLLKKYLTPPDEAIEESPIKSANSSQSSQSKRDDFPEDAIYSNLEFREILTDCIAIFAEGRELMTQLYDSVINEQKNDDTVLPPNCTVHL